MSGALRHALVTGASSEVGQAIGAALQAQGHVVFGTSRTAPGEGSSFQQHIPGDIGDPLFRKALVAGLPPIDTFVHAAGHRFDYQRLHLQTDEAIRASWNIEYHAFEDLCRQLLPPMMARRDGRIVVISSLAAQVAGPGSAVYGAAKAACEGLARGIGCDYGRFRITANAVAPGPIDNDRLRARLPDAAAVGQLARRAALKRLVTPAEVASVVAFLTGPGGASITGQTLTVAAGLDLNAEW